MGVALLAASAALMVLVGDAGVSEARSFREAQIPNGARNTCGTCHGSQRSIRNSFGQDVEASLNPLGGMGNVDWGAIYDEDSDGDGFTNGEELGDPDGDCVSTEGRLECGDLRPIYVSHPGDRNDFPVQAECGNGVVDRGEECDGEDLRNASCENLGFTGGDVECSRSCTLDVDECTVCGDGVAEGSDEECDGDDLAAETCESLGFLGGDLECSGGCAFDTSACQVDPENPCGDGARADDEECDGEDLGGQTCEGLGLISGELTCGRACTLDASECSTCGNSVIDGDEECDSAELGEGVCPEGTVGEVACAEDCSLDLSACEASVSNNGTNNGGTNNGGTNNGGTNNGGTNNGADNGADAGGSSGDGGCAVGAGSFSSSPAAVLLVALGWFVLRRK
jgi:hypothetical protein